ncbi:MAG TPA: transporter [Burkholderiales bacterium]|nr:transporter [Burkholderiales bacterium]
MSCSALAQTQQQPDDAARALERALTREGGLVLAPRTYELEPRFEYSHRRTEGLDIVTAGGVSQVARRDVKHDRLDASLGLRAGLSNRMHAELRVPYAFVRESEALAGQTGSTRHDHGRGDVELGLTKQIAEAGYSRPGVLASVNWRLPTGRFELGQPSPGRGFHNVQAAVTVVTRDDPLVLFGSVSYTWVPRRSHDGVEVNPGDPLGLKLGTILAASPRTSVRGMFELTRAGRTSFGGAHVPGSDTVSAALQFGLSMLVTARSLVDLQIGAGLTPDAPDFTMTLAVPVRFQ